MGARGGATGFAVDLLVIAIPLRQQVGAKRTHVAGVAWIQINQILIVIGNTVGFAIRSRQQGAARSAEGRAIQLMGAIAVDDLFGAGKVMGIGRTVFFAYGVFGPIAAPRAPMIFGDQGAILGSGLTRC